MTSLGNYTGPYVSDGKFQTSVEWGEAETLNPLDEASRRHDSAYARFSDRKHRMAADVLYKLETDRMNGSLPGIAGNAVVYGNEALEQGGDLSTKLTLTRAAGANPLAGLVAHELSWLYDMNERLNTRDWLAKEKQEVLDYYKTDPRAKAPIRQVDSAPRQVETTVDVVPTVSHAPAQRGDDFTPVEPYSKPSSGRVAVDHTETDNDGVPLWSRLPNGRWYKRKKKQKTTRISPEVSVKQPAPRMAAWAERAVLQDMDQKHAQAHYWPHRFDLKWNVNPLKMKRNKVVALTTK